MHVGGDNDVEEEIPSNEISSWGNGWEESLCQQLLLHRAHVNLGKWQQKECQVLVTYLGVTE